MHCGRCGNSCPPEARFCPRCGERLAAMDQAALGEDRPYTGADAVQDWPSAGSGRQVAADSPFTPPQENTGPYPHPWSGYPPAGSGDTATGSYGALWPDVPSGSYNEAPGSYSAAPPAAPYPPASQPYPLGGSPLPVPGPYAGYGPGPLDPAYPSAGIPLPGRQRLIESVYPGDQLVTASAGRRLGAAALDLTFMFVTLFIGWFVWFCIVARNGQTPGKQLLGMYVLRDDGTRASGWYMWLREALIKGIFGFAAFFTIGLVPLLAAAWCLWDNDTQCLWDKIGSTHVGYSPYGFKPLTRNEQRRLLP